MNLKEFSDGLRDSERLEAENAELRARLQSVTAGHARDLDVLAERAERAEAELKSAKLFIEIGFPQRELTDDDIQEAQKIANKAFSDAIERAEKAESENLQWRQAHEDLQAIMRTQAEQSAATCRDLLRRAERAEAQAAVLREALTKALNVGDLGISMRGQDFMCMKCGRRSSDRNTIPHPSYCPSPSLYAALANTDAGKGLLEIVRCAEKYVERYRGCGGSNGLFSEMETIVDAYHAQQGGGIAETSSHDGEEV
jgi:hypothetical protein